MPRKTLRELYGRDPRPDDLIEVPDDDELIDDLDDLDDDEEPPTQSVASASAPASMASPAAPAQSPAAPQQPAPPPGYQESGTPVDPDRPMSVAEWEASLRGSELGRQVLGDPERKFRSLMDARRSGRVQTPEDAARRNCTGQEPERTGPMSEAEWEALMVEAEVGREVLVTQASRDAALARARAAGRVV